MNETIRKLIENDVLSFLAGGAIGFDTIAAHAVPESAIKSQT